MTPAGRPTQFGRIHAPDEAWLGRNPPEPILEPDLPIVDTHHHLWDRDGHRYFVPEFMADVASGHHVVATVFLECHSMYRASGPTEMRPVGETEFVAGQAAMSASGLYGPGRAAAAFVSFVSPEAQFTPKEVETRSEREKLMFRVKIQVPKELVTHYIEYVKTGVRGVGYVKVDPNASWPDWLQNDLVRPDQLGVNRPATTDR